jgi:pyruvate dehydrogenase E2 component (dihydrolipoamide acetyltransferase)
LAGSEGIDIGLVQGTGPNGRVTEQDVRNFIEQLKSTSPEITTQVVPKARKLASDHQIDLGDIEGTGPSGRITVVDVERHIAKSGPQIPLEDILESIPIVGMRKIISERMSLSSSETAPVTLTTEVDMTETIKVKESLVSKWRKEKLRPLDLYLTLKAVVDSLREHSIINATLNGNDIIVMKHVNLGVAVALPDGLIVPVLREAENMDLVDIARNIGDLTRKARDNKLSIDEVTGSTFTVTSLAAYDIDGFTPIINVPEIAILGVGRIIQKPWGIDGEVVLRHIMTLSLTFDHRAIDGVPAGDFLKTLKLRLENPSN